jgi:DNA-binding response OmpR family regulator
MTLEVSAPSWPARVIAVESSASAVTRGRAAEFRKSGLFVEGSETVAAALVSLGKDPTAVPLVPSDLHGMPVRDFVEVVRAFTATPVIVGLTADDPDPALDATRTVRLPVTPTHLARVIEESRPQGLVPAVECHEVGGLRLDVESFRVHWHGDEVHVPPRLFELLRYFAVAHPRIVTIEELISEFGANGNTRDRGERVRVMIGRARTLFTLVRPDLAPPLETVHRVGYRLTGA